MGDFNFPFENVENKNSRKLHDIIGMFNLTQSVSEPEVIVINITNLQLLLAKLPVHLSLHTESLTYHCGQCRPELGPLHTRLRIQHQSRAGKFVANPVRMILSLL